MIATQIRRRPRASDRRSAGLLLAALARALQAPGADLLVVSGQQDVGHLPAAVLRRPGVVRIFRMAAERRGERLLERRVAVAERAGLLAQHRVAEHHRGQLAAGEDVLADRDRVAGEVLDDALVEALVAPAQQR